MPLDNCLEYTDIFNTLGFYISIVVLTGAVCQEAREMDVRGPPPAQTM